jgi:uncharacterized repeat protein (TIGR02543 family)
MLNRFLTRWVFFVFLALTTFGQLAMAATFIASNEAQLSTALSSAAPGDTISLLGDIVVTSTKTLNMALTIEGNGYTISVPEPGLDAAGIKNPSASTFGVFRTSATAVTIDIRNLSIMGGQTRGAGLYVEANASVTLTNVTVSNCASDAEGGGGIFNQGTLRMTRSRLSRNAAVNGAGFMNEGTMFVDQSTLSENRATGTFQQYGGGGNSTGALYINNTTFSNNSSYYSGAAMSVTGGTAWVMNSTITGNTTWGNHTNDPNTNLSSGGFDAIGGGVLNLINNVFAYNIVTNADYPTSAFLRDINATATGNVGNGTITPWYNVFHGLTEKFAFPAVTTGCVDDYGPTCDLDFGRNLCGDAFVQDLCKAFCGICTGGSSSSGGAGGLGTTNVMYGGAIDGSDNTIFTGGSLGRVTNGDGVPIGSLRAFRPLLNRFGGVDVATLKTGSLLANSANRGVKVGFKPDGSVIGFFDRLGTHSSCNGTPCWVDLKGSGASGFEVTTDVLNSPRSNPTMRGETELTLDDLFLLKVLPPANLAADGSVSGGTLYGDVYSKGVQVTVSAFPATGKEFAKWVNENGADVSTANPYTVTMTANLTLQPVFNSLPSGQFSITYLGNGNTGGSAPATDGPSATAPKTIAAAGSLVRTGFTFAGWNTRANGSGTAYAASDSYSTVANLTLYAQWTAVPPTLTAVSPNQGALAGGNRITLTGTGLFRPLTITVGGSPCTDVQSTDPNTATCLTPAHAAGAVDVVVGTPQGGPVTLSNGFTYINAPTVGLLPLPFGSVGGGTLITVGGTGFVTGHTSVAIDGRACTSVNVTSSTELTCITPAGASTGSKTLTITTPGGTVNGGSFVYNTAPALTSVTPDRGPAAGGTTLTLSGSGYGADTHVTVGGVACALQSVTATQLTCVTPAGSGTAAVNVNTPGGTATASFTYTNVPTIKLVKPSQGPTAGGGTLQLTGTSFTPGTTVTVGGLVCGAVQVTSDTHLTCTLPAHSVGSVTVTVATTGGSANGTYIYDDVPTLSAVTPSQGPTRGGTQLTLTGTGFIPGMGVTVGGAACRSLAIQDQTTATCLTPVSSAGAQSVLVTTPGGTSGAQPFTYDNQPTLTKTSLEAKTAGGSALVITGAAFIPGYTTITVDGQGCPITTSSTTGLQEISDTRVVCRAPAHAVGPVPLVLTTPGGSVAATVTYVDAPTATALTPGRGPRAGGTPITITGSGFSAGTSVFILGAGSCQSLQRISEAEMTCITPPSASAGVKSVLVGNAGGSAPLLHFIYDDLPALQGISPNQGPLSGGNTITLTGSSFVPGSTTVSIGGAACTQVTVVSSSELNCKAPARGTAGSVAVTVTTSGGTSTGNINYTYDDVPSVTGITPDQGAQAGGTTVTVTGSGFVPGSTTVTIGGVPCTAVTVVDAHTLTCLTGAGTGAAGVSVATPGGGVTAGVSFSYDPQPTLSGIDPSFGPTSGGNVLRLLGSGFVSGSTRVRIGGSDCTLVQYLTDKENRCTAPAGTAGQKAVNVITPGGIAMGAYTYTDAPTLASAAPATGPRGGGTTLTLTGSNFVAGTTVTVGGNTCSSLNVVSATSMTCVTPAGTVGIVDVIVSNSNGTMTGSFTYSNTVPVAGPMTVLTYLNHAVSGQLVAVDADADALTYVKVSDPGHGTLTLDSASTGAATYTPASGYVGSDSFSYKVNDGTSDSNIYTVQITVQPTPTAPNQPPLAGNDIYQTTKNTPLVIAAPGLLANDLDPDNGPTTLVIATLPSSAPSHGTLTPTTGGGFTYTPASNYVGLDSFTYTASDGAAVSNTASVTLDIRDANFAPIAHDDSYSTPAGVKLVVPAPGLLTNDSDPDGNQPLSVVIASQPTQGTLSLTAGGFEYTPNLGATCSADAADSFTYYANDSVVNSNLATVSLSIHCTNRAPVAVADSYSIGQGGQLNIPPKGVLVNDTDADGNPLRMVLVSSTSQGPLAENPDGSFSYRAPNTAGTDSFTYKATDGALESAVTTVTITITATNQAPLAGNDSYRTTKNVNLQVSKPGVLGNDIDADGNALTLGSVLTQPTNGSLSANPDGSFTYQPNANFVGLDSFVYVASDGTAVSPATTVVIEVADTNTAPVAANDSYSVASGTRLVVPAPGLLANDVDPDGNQPLRVVLASQPANGTLMLTPGGGFEYTPKPSAICSTDKTDKFTYTANDGAANSNAATVHIAIHCTNQTPLVNADGYTVAQGAVLNLPAPGVMVNDSDPDGNTLSAIVVTQPTKGALAFNPNGSFSYRAVTAGADSFTYKVSDGALDSAVATVTINVTATNQLPLAAGDSYTTAKNVTLQVSKPGVLGNDLDPDGNTLSLGSVITQPAHGSLHMNLDGSFTYTPAANYAGLDNFTYTANDSAAVSNVATVVIDVRDANTAPIAQDDSYSTPAGVKLTVAAPGLLANDSDPDGKQPLSVVLASQPALGSLTLTSGGGFEYTPNTATCSADRTDSFTYYANDSVVNSNLASVRITIQCTNGAPVAAADSYTAQQGVQLAIPAPGLLGNDSDPDGNDLTARLISPPANGVLVLNADGSFSYTPSTSFVGSDSFTYSVNDGKADSAAATVSLTVVAAATPPSCGSANGVATEFKPSADLCTAGTPSSVVSGSPWTWTCSVGGNSQSCSAPNGPTGSNSGLGRIELTTKKWRVLLSESAGFIGLTGEPKSPPSPPPGVTFPHGLVHFKLDSGPVGSVASLVITFPSALPAGTVYWKYGPTSSNPAPHWYTFPGAVISGNTITLNIQDGGDGDDDLLVNSVIEDAGGPGVSSTIPVAPASIPTLSEWGMVVLSMLMLAAVAMRRRSIGRLSIRIDDV